MPASDAYDVVVIGAGAGGMTAAAVAASEGLSVLLIEKTEFVGGTTAWSGGMVWIPANAHMKEAGMPDRLSDAAAYLAGTVPEIENAGLRETFLARGPEAVEYLEATTEVRLQPVKTYPDYYPEQPGATAGGRVLEPVSFDGAGTRCEISAAASAAAGIHCARRDDGQPARHSPPSPIRALLSFNPAFAASCVAICAAAASRAQRKTLHLGNALAARLYASLLARNVEVLFGTSVERLLIEDGAIGGVQIKDSSGSRPIVARKGVVLATGGFSHDKNLRERYFPAAAGSVSAASPAGSGDGLRVAMAAGASIGTSVASPAYGCPRHAFSARMAAREFSRIP